MKAYLTIAALTALTACGNSGSSEKPIEPVQVKEDPFTLSCEGFYDVGGNKSRIWFKATLYPELGKAIIFDQDGKNLNDDSAGTYNGPKDLFASEDRVSVIYEYDDKYIRFKNQRFGINLDRISGRFWIAGLEGTCEKTELVEKDVSGTPKF